MKRLLLTLLLAVPCMAQISYVNEANTWGAGSGQSATLSTTASNLGVIFVHTNQGNDTLSVSCTGNTVVTDITCYNNRPIGITEQFFWITSLAGGSTTCTLTSTLGSPYSGITVAQYSGQAASGVWDACGLGYTGSGNVTTDNITTTTNNEMLAGAADCYTGIGSDPTVPSGYTQRQRNLTSGTFYDAYYDNTNTNTAGTYNFFSNSSCSTSSSAMIAAFRSVAPAGASASQIGAFAVGP